MSLETKILRINREEIPYNQMIKKILILSVSFELFNISSRSHIIHRNIIDFTNTIKICSRD